ncbi:sterile alpha motif domain-containing protein 9-like isoform X2 [Clupea harengus]|uniref:Sterile alpha motif domain-containing protein 9-like isoform X2 n=1 Tax=Clupea harengus TaxID=7950 RepID=A0A6P8FNL3_CLUHA|nr:sterile alpha motif domain-containing protein 9-like isoform X2 [Clupea harengus]
MEFDNVPFEKWTEALVSSWLRSIGVKEQYVTKLNEEEVDGRILLELTEDYLKKETGMKSGPALLIIKKRNELVESLQRVQKVHRNQDNVKREDSDANNPPQTTGKTSKAKETDTQALSGLTSKRDCKPRPLGKDGIDFTYIKHNVLQPESGVIDLIAPCHEYKSFAIAATLDRTRLQAKFAKEVLKFGTGCMNIRSNGTIHFGVMDSRDDAGYVHGEIIGVPVPEKDIYVDALDHIEKSLSSADGEHVRQCIRPPQFIEVIEMNSSEKRYVVEVDIVPAISIVRNRVYSVCLPNFKEKSNKVEHEKRTIYCRVGSKTEPVSDPNEFYERVRDRDARREEAEQSCFDSCPDFSQDLGRKLTMLVTSGKKFIEKEKWYILITNKFEKFDLSSIDFLLNMKIFSVFDFDADSKVSGLCSEYLKHHAANLHFMQNYQIPTGMSISEFESHLHLFEQTSWIFCNGRNDFKGNENQCDEMTWIKTKMTLLRECVSVICKQILPKGTFLVVFLLTSPVEKPLLHTFNEFFTDMEGHEDIICISESEDNFQKWQSFAEGSCGAEMVNRSSIVGMKMSHVNATLQRIQPMTSRASKHLPVYVKGECNLETREEERIYSLEILSVNHCDETSSEFVEDQRESIEREFYHGGKVNWLNLWLADKKFVGEVIQRDAYQEISDLINDNLKRNIDQLPVSCFNIYHHPGSGGSTVARQVLWSSRKVLRCAVVKPSYSVATVSEHAFHLREYEEKNTQKCLPVLLLLEDCDKEYQDDLKKELEVAVNTKKIARGTLCFVLLSCRRSHNPERMCRESPLENVAITHKLSDKEKRLFAGKRKTLEQQYQPEFILTFVLMSEEFDHQKIVEYVQKFVTHLLQGIDHASVVTRLIRYVALLNTYVQNSFISQSHCEALLALTIHMDRFRQHAFERSLSEQAKLVFIHLRDDRTYIQSVRIIHPLVAKEILQQLLGDQLQSQLALDLLREDVLFENRFGKDDYMKFLRALFMRRSRISKGDESDSFFSPLIDHVRENESPKQAIELLTEAYKRFNKDAFFAQQLARLNYRYDQFEDAKHWAEIAASKMPTNSYILDTRGQVYRRWFTAKCKALDKVTKTPENTADAIDMALKALECFQQCEKAAIADVETMNNSGFFAAVEVGCSLLKLLFSLQIFSNKNYGSSECLKYLITDYIPEPVMKPWEHFHCKLKNLRFSMCEALEWISEDLSYFQTDLSTDEEETTESCETKINHPKNWLVNKSSVYGKYFCDASLETITKQSQSNPDSWTPFMKRMLICRLGGGNITTIFSLLSDQKDKNQVKVLEDIISLYPRNPLKARLDQMDLSNYIATHIALSCLSPQSPKLATLKDLQKLSQQFPNEKRDCLSSALFLLTLLFWPEEHDTEDVKDSKYGIVLSAVEFLKRSYWTKMKDIPQRRRRIFTHFFLGNGNGFDKFVHKTKVEKITKLLSVSEKRMKWFRGEVWKMPEITELCKRATGWTEDGTVYLEGPRERKFNIPALNTGSVPYGNENVTFYLGFTFRGPVAYNVTAKL